MSSQLDSIKIECSLRHASVWSSPKSHSKAPIEMVECSVLYHVEDKCVTHNLHLALKL